VWSEEEFQAQLDNTGIVGRIDLAEPAAEGGVHTVKLRVVESVEKLGTELLSSAKTPSSRSRDPVTSRNVQS
jgi:hypothetical protein